MDNEQLVADLLAHHGIKGMKWGIHSRSRSDDGDVRVAGSFGKGKAVITTSGGGGHPPHEDAIASRVIKQKLEKSGSHSLSNYELRQLQDRLTLEQNVARLSPPEPGRIARGAQAVSKVITSPEAKTAIQIAKMHTGDDKVKRALDILGAARR